MLPLHRALVPEAWRWRRYCRLCPRQAARRKGRDMARQKDARGPQGPGRAARNVCRSPLAREMR